jgi:hypothetical protein
MISEGAAMAHPYHHALSSVKKWGGTVEDYQAIHAWYDSSKAHSADFRHRAMFHHAAGIWLSETVFGPTITLSTGRVIPTRWVGEQHVREDLGFIPSFTDWVKAIRPEPWMGRTEKIEALVDPHLAPPVWRSADMSRAYLNLGVSPEITPLAMLRVAIGRLHPDTLAVRSWRAARKRYYRELLQAHAEAQVRAHVACE